MQKTMLLSLLSVFLILPSVLNGQIEVLRPGVHPTQGNYDTLSWRTLNEPTEHFSPYSNDSVAVWFNPSGPCSLMAIRYYGSSEIELNADVWNGSRYDGHITTTDSTDSNGWIGSHEDNQWIPGPVIGHSLLGWNPQNPQHHLWMSYPVTIYSNPDGRWYELPAAIGLQGEVDLGDEPFFVVMAVILNYGGTLGAESEGTKPYHVFTAASSQPGPDGEHFGWFIRSASVWIEAVVKYYDATEIEQDHNSKGPGSYVLFQNYPNPFNSTTDIRYQIADGRSPSHTTLKIYNLLGQEVRTLVDKQKAAGDYTDTWDGRDASGQAVASGVYFFSLTVGDFTSARRMLLLK
jgi:hypothetical protein